VLHIGRAVPVARIIRVIKFLPELVDVVEVEKGWQTIRVAVNVKQKLLRQRIEILKLVFCGQREREREKS